MTSTFQFELVSPEKTILSKPALMVTVPGEEGEFGVLVGHSPLITFMKPGVICVYENEETNITDKIFVAGGFVEVTGERCVVLAEEAMLVSELDRSVIENEMRSLTEDLSAEGSDNKRASLEAKLEVVRAKYAALQ